MAGEKVQCPICGKLVPESDINLHLDLQCLGSPSAGPSSTPAKGDMEASSIFRNTRPGPTVKRSSQSSQRSSSPQRRQSANQIQIVDEDVLGETPVKAEKKVAAIFGGGSNSAKRKVQEEEEKQVGISPGGETFTATHPDSAGNRGSRPRGSEAGREDKKPRVNPLIASQPLAERSRPASLANYVGQTDLVGPGSLLRARIEAGEGVGSCILWGPPGSGKTTLARLIAKTANADFKELSATSAGTADVRQVFEQAKNGLKLTGRQTILMVDEIHRFNKPQQDLFLPYVENGWVQLIGATTENPSFKVNGALLSRCQVFTLSPHTPESLQQILENALASLPAPIPHLPPDLLPFLADVADGDARQALNGLELALKVCEGPRQAHLASNGSVRDPADDDNEERKKRDAELMDAVRRGLRKGYDRSGEERYDMISALHKSLRGSDGSAAMYWLARMLTGGEDPLYIARRLVVMSSEDVGLADPHALPLAMATYQACQVIGMPECRINLAHAVAYLAEAPKSTRSYTAYKRAEALATTPPLPGVPLQIRNAPTTLMKKLGYGKHYSYDPDYSHPVYNEYLPFTLSRNSSSSLFPDEQILKTPEAEARDKKFDDDRLAEWEWKVNGNARWEGRKVVGENGGADGGGGGGGVNKLGGGEPRTKNGNDGDDGGGGEGSIDS